MDEKQLIRKSAEGNIECFEELIASYERKVYSIACKMLGNEADAYDAAQEVFIKIYKSIKNFKGDAAFSTWVYKITSNVCLDTLRKNKNRKAVISLDKEIELSDSDVTFEIEDKKVNIEEELLKDERSRTLHEAIGKLPPEQKNILILREFEQLSYEEIAEALNLNLGTVKSKINRARQALKNELLKNKELFLGLAVLILWNI